MFTSLCAVNRNSAVQVDYFAPQSLCRLKVETIIVDEKPLQNNCHCTVSFPKSSKKAHSSNSCPDFTGTRSGHFAKGFCVCFRKPCVFLPITQSIN